MESSTHHYGGYVIDEINARESIHGLSEVVRYRVLICVDRFALEVVVNGRDHLRVRV